MDAAKWPLHPHLTRWCVRDATACASNRIYFFSRYTSTRADLRQLKPNRFISAEYRCVSVRKRKSAGKGKKKNLNRKYRWILIQDSHCRCHNFTGLNPFFHCFFVLFFLSLFFFWISFVKGLPLKRLYFGSCALWLHT